MLADLPMLGRDDICTDGFPEIPQGRGRNPRSLRRTPLPHPPVRPRTRLPPSRSTGAATLPPRLAGPPGTPESAQRIAGVEADRPAKIPANPTLFGSRTEPTCGARATSSRNSTAPPVRLAATSIPLPRPPWNARCKADERREARIGPRRRPRDVLGPHSGPRAQRRGARPEPELRVALEKRGRIEQRRSTAARPTRTRSRYRRARRRSRRRAGTSGLFARPSGF